MGDREPSLNRYIHTYSDGGQGALIEQVYIYTHTVMGGREPSLNRYTHTYSDGGQGALIEQVYTHIQ